MDEIHRNTKKRTITISKVSAIDKELIQTFLESMLVLASMFFKGRTYSPHVPAYAIMPSELEQGVSVLLSQEAGGRNTPSLTYPYRVPVSAELLSELLRQLF